MVGGFFPAPYPDECLYSIFCRYYVRSGLTREAASKVLFGKIQGFKPSVYLPMDIERVENWFPLSSNITRYVVANNHTLYPYLAISCSPRLRSEFNKVFSGEPCSMNTTMAASFKIKRSRAEFFKYCPICAAEDKDKFGETYWHRNHQLNEMLYCTKHEIRLMDSSVPVAVSSL